MDGERFDHLAKAVAVGSRRGVIRLLAAGALGLGLPGRPGAAVLAARKKRPLCAKKPFKRCTKPASEAFRSAVAACRPVCSDPNAAECQTCLQPAIDAAVAAGVACLEQVCRGGPGRGEDSAESTAGVGRAARNDTQTCESLKLGECAVRVERDTVICLGLATLACLETAGLGCAGAIAGCFAQMATRVADCTTDFGCKKGGWCIKNICCPYVLDTVCNGVCCSYRTCERCDGGVCRGCTPPKQCEGAPSERRCLCLGQYRRCGETCCDSAACEECLGGVCQGCRPPRVCRGRLIRTCECPNDWEECGELCCPQGRCVDGRCCRDDAICNGVCCDPGEVCCGGPCCSEYRCLNGTCCGLDVCGDIGSSTRVCPTESEHCCYAADPAHPGLNRGFACPVGTDCARPDLCCPVDKSYWHDECGGGACCPGVTSPCQECVPPTPGRSS